MTKLADVAAKVAKLIPRLASAHDPEVVTTVRAIEQVLRGAGCDLHDLAAAISAPPTPTAPEIVADPPPPARPQQRPPPTWGKLSTSRRHAWLEALRAQGHHLTPSETALVHAINDHPDRVLSRPDAKRMSDLLAQAWDRGVRI